MSKSAGQIVGGLVGGVVGFIGSGFNPLGAVKGFMVGSSIGGMIDPPPGPDLKGPTLEDKSFNSAAYGVSLATLHGTIAHTPPIIYLENNEYKSVAKKEKTGGKGGSPQGSYTTTTYYATFAVAIGEAMPGSAIRRIWAGGKLIYSVGVIDADTLTQSDSNSTLFGYYDGTQTEPDSRMEASLGVGNCPSYEGTAYIIFYDFDLTDYGNGLQGCPIKIEVAEEYEAQKVFGDFVRVTIDSVLNCSQTLAEDAVTIYTASADDVLEISLDSGAYTRNVGADYWRTQVKAVGDFGLGGGALYWNIGDDGSHDTPEEAMAAFGGPYILTGATSYSFYIYDGGAASDNFGTVILRYPVYLSQPAVVSRKIPLVDILNKIFLASGIDLSYTDFSELSGIEVNGYKVSDVGSARGKLGPLQIAYLFDLIEDGYTIKAVKRGGGSTATIPLSKLGARGAGEAAGVRVIRDRETESQLPSRYSLTYVDYNREYDTNTQYNDYPSRASNEVNKQLPLVLTATEAAQLADVLINLAWVERFSYEFTLSQEFAFLKPSNVITVEVAAGAWVVLRISNITYSADQRIQIAARRAEPAVYQSGAVGIDVEPPAENIPRITNANTVMMDLPAITDDVTNYGFGVAMYGSATWPGGALLRSIDSGQTYDAIQAYTANCTVAEAVNVLPAGDYFVIDRSSELTLTVLAGEFFSITEAQMLTGKHYCAYGADGRWEIMQYATATVISGSSIKLSTFVRGLFGTEWACNLHQVGDKVVLLDDPDTAFIGADAVALNAQRKFKGVTLGQDAQPLDEIDFTYRGTNLKPLSPVNVTGTLVSEVWTISCTKRTRMASNQWATGIAAPIGEAALLFEFEFYEGAVFKKMYQSPTETFVYSSVNQLADFGYLPTTLTVKIYQISAVVGRGFGVERTLVGVGDVYANNVVLLLHGRGEDGSTVITDGSLFAFAVDVFGDAKITTLQYKYSGSSIFFGGSGYLRLLDSEDLYFSGSDFTIECWIYGVFNSGGYVPVVSQLASLSSDSNRQMLSYSSSTDSTLPNAWTFFDYSTSTQIDLRVADTPPTNSWFHFALSRQGNNYKFFRDGVQIGTTRTSTVTPRNIDGNLYVGLTRLGGALRYLNGCINDLRITKGVARYTSAFTPPTQPLPDPI